MRTQTMIIIIINNYIFDIFGEFTTMSRDQGEPLTEAEKLEEFEELIEYMYKRNSDVFSTKNMNGLLKMPMDNKVIEDKNLNTVKNILIIEPNIFDILHSHWKNSYDIIITMAVIDGMTLHEIDKSLFKDRNFVKKCLSNCDCPWIFNHIPIEDQSDIGYVVELINIDGWVYIHLNDYMKSQPYIIKIALYQANDELLPWICCK
jgi:hypothetical protein